MNATEIKQLTEAAKKEAGEFFDQKILLVSDPEMKEVLQKFRSTYILIRQANVVAARALPDSIESAEIMHCAGNASGNIMAIVQLAGEYK